MMKSVAWVVVLAAASLAGCDDGGSDGGGGAGGAGGGGGGADMGVVGPEAYYSGLESAALGHADNEARCATCHSTNGDQLGFSGNTFKDIAYRSAFKGGSAPTLLDATNACVTGWMGGEALTAQDPAWIALEGFLQGLSDPGVTAPNLLEPEVLTDELAYEAAYTGGDAAAGGALYEQACGVCHTTEITVGNRVSFSKEVLRAFTVGRIAQKVRTSGPPPSGIDDLVDSTPGPMPFFEVKDLSEEGLRDVIAFIKEG